jgi:hypothetical protein
MWTLLPMLLLWPGLCCLYAALWLHMDWAMWCYSLNYAFAACFVIHLWDTVRVQWYLVPCRVVQTLQLPEGPNFPYSLGQRSGFGGAAGPLVSLRKEMSGRAAR